MKKTTKLLSVLLCLAMLISAMPCVSFAAEPFSASDDFSTTSSIPNWVAAKGWYHNNSFEGKTHSSYEIVDGMLHIKKNANESGNGIIYYKAQETTLNSGIITVSADIKIEGGGAIPGGVYSTAFISSGPKMIAGTVGTQLKAEQFNSGTGQVLSNEFNDGKWYTIKAVFNYTTGKMYVSYIPQGETTGVISNEFDFNKATALNYVSFAPAFTNLNTVTYADKSDIDFYIDNFSIIQEFAPEVTDSSVKDGDTDVYLNDSFSLYFTKAINAESAKNITLESKAGAVSANITVDGTKVTIDPVSALQPVSTYTINVPATVTDTNGTAVTAKTITFTTGRVAETTGYVANFEEFDGTESVGTIMGTLNEYKAEPDWITQYAVNGSKYIRYPADNYPTSYGGYIETANSMRWGQNAANPYILDGTDNRVYVKDGKLNLERNFTVPSTATDVTTHDGRIFAIMAGKTENYIKSGGVHVKFDLNLKTSFSGLYNTSFINFVGLFSMGVNGSKLFFKGPDQETWQTLALLTNFGTGLYTFDFMVDLDSNKVLVNINGTDYGPYTITDSANGFYSLNFSHTASQVKAATELDFELDNISIIPVGTPKVLETEISGFEESITVDFDQLMTAPSGAITVTDSVGGTVDCAVALAENGYQYVITPASGTLPAGVYTVTIPVQTAANGLKTAETTVTYTRQASNSAVLEVADCKVYGELSANSAIKVEATFKNISADAQKPWVGVALYDASGNIKKIACGEIDIAAGEKGTAEVTFKAPEDAGQNAYIRVFAWDAIASISPVCHDIRYPAAQ